MSHSAIQTVLLVVGTVTAHASLPLSARGVNFSWSNSTGGNFNADANWTGPPGYPDDGGDTAIFNLLAGYTVQFNSNITNNNAEVNSGTVTWDLVDEGGSEPETFDYTLDATSGLALHVGSAPGSLFQALLIVDGAFFPQPIFSNSTVTTSRPVQIGRDANSSGTLNLAGGAWEGAGSLDVGVNGDGALIVSGGMTSSTGVLGANAGSEGTATIHGRWDMSQTLAVGRSGSGTLTIENGDVANGGNVFIAESLGSTGAVNILRYSRWHCDASVYVGGNTIASGGAGQLLMSEPNLASPGPSMHVDGDLVVRSSGSVVVEDDSRLDVVGLLRMDSGAEFSIGPAQNDVGVVNAGSARIGNASASGGDTTLDITGPDVSLTVANELTIGAAAGFGALVELADRATLASNTAQVSNAAGLKSEIRLGSATGTAQWNNAGAVYLGGTATVAGGTGTLFINPGGALTAGGIVKVWNGYVVELDGGTLATPTLEVLGTVHSAAPLDFDTPAIGQLALAGGTVTAPVIDLGSDPFSGFGVLAGDVVADGSITATGNLTLGDANSFNGVVLNGNLNVGAHQVTINKRGFFNVGGFTNIAGGALVAPNGVNLPDGVGLVASGAISGRIVAQAGSTIEATGNLALGDAASVAGFFSDGELDVNTHIVTLRDANEALLGSLTTLGDAGAPGFLVAANGAVVEFGKNVVGFGRVDTPNNPAKPLINNGFIGGTSAAQPITLPGYVKGVGTLDNVVITGTDAPGFSPATVTRGSVVYDGRLAIEIGGASVGSFDQIHHTLGGGVADLGGSLDVSLINGFTPLLGHSFQLLTASGGVVGEFDTLLLPALAGGLRWEIAYGASDVLLTVAAGLSADFDHDGDVDGDDLVQWQGDFGLNGESDADSDGDSDGADFLAWQQQLGSGFPASGAGTSVPEPAAAVTSLAAGLLLVILRRRPG